MHIFILSGSGVVSVGNDEKIIPLPISVGIVQDTLSFLLISTTSAALLHISF